MADPKAVVANPEAPAISDEAFYRAVHPLYSPTPPVGQESVATVPEPSMMGSLGTGLDIGVDQFKQRAYEFSLGGSAKLLRMAGLDSIADEWERQVRISGLQGEAYRLELQNQLEYEYPTEWADVDNVGSFAKFGLYAFAKESPQLAFNFAAAIGTAIVTKNPVATVAAFATPSYVMNTGEIYASILAETGRHNFGIAALAGIPAAFLDTLPWSKALTSIGKGAGFGNYIGKAFSGKGKFAKPVAGAVELGVLEGTTEGLQNVIEQMAVDYISERNIPFDWAQYKENVAAGGAIGMLMGPFTSIGGGSQTNRPIPNLPPVIKENEVTEEAREALRLRQREFMDEAQRAHTNIDEFRRPIKGKKPSKWFHRYKAGETTPSANRIAGFTRGGVGRVQEDAEAIQQANTSAGEVVREKGARRKYSPESGVVSRPEAAEVQEEIKRGANRAQASLDEAYDKATKRSEELTKSRDKIDIDSPQLETAEDALELADLRRAVIGLRSALKDREEGAEGTTRDGRTVEEYIDEVANFQARYSDNNVSMIAAVKQAVDKVDFSSAMRLMGLQHTKAVALESKRTLRRGAKKEKRERKQEEKSASGLTEILSQLDLESPGKRDRLVAALREVGITTQVLGIKANSGFNKIMEGVRGYMGQEGAARLDEAAIKRDEDTERKATQSAEATEKVRQITAVADVVAQDKAEARQEKISSEKEEAADRASNALVDAKNYQRDKATQRDAVIIRDTMEKAGSTAWKSVPDEISEKDVRDLADGVINHRGEKTPDEVIVDVSELSIDEVLSVIRAVSNKFPITKQEADTAKSLFDEGKTPGEVERIVKSDRRLVEAEKYNPVDFQNAIPEFKWDVYNVLGIENIWDWAGFDLLPEVFRHPSWLTSQPKVVDEEVTPVLPVTNSQIWYPGLFSYRGDSSPEGIVSSAIYNINGAVREDKKGVTTKAYGLRGRNYSAEKEAAKETKKLKLKILKANNNKQRELAQISLQSHLKRVEDNKWDLIDVRSDKPLNWHPENLTSSQFKKSLLQWIETAYQEPKEIEDVKAAAQSRLAEKLSIKEGTKEWKALRPLYVALNGTYVLKPKEVEYRYDSDPETMIVEEGGKSKTVPFIRKLRPERADLLVAYNSQDEIIAVRDFDRRLQDDFKEALDAIKKKFQIKAGSRTHTWEDKPGEAYQTEENPTPKRAAILQLVKRFRGRLSVELIGIYKDLKGRTVPVNMSDLSLAESGALDNMSLEDIIWSTAPEQVFQGFGQSPYMRRVWVGKESDIPSTLKRFLMKPQEKEWGNVFVTRYGLSYHQDKGFERWKPWREQPEGRGETLAEELGEYEKLSTKERKKFTRSWKMRSPIMTVTINTPTGPKVVEGYISNFTPDIFAPLGDQTDFTATIGQPTKEGRVLQRKLFTKKDAIVYQAESPDGAFSDYVQVTPARYEFTPLKGRKISFSPNEVTFGEVSINERGKRKTISAYDVVAPNQVPATTAQIVHRAEDNLFQEKENIDTFLQRASYTHVEPVIGVGAKVKIIPESVVELKDKYINYLYTERRNLRLRDEYTLDEKTNKFVKDTKGSLENFTNKTKEEIEFLWNKNHPLGGLLLFKDGKGTFLRPFSSPEETYAVVASVEKDSKGGDQVYLEPDTGFPSRGPYRLDQLVPVSSAVAPRESTSLQIIDGRPIAIFKGAKESRLTPRVKIDELTPEKKLKPQDVKVGDVVQLRTADVFAKDEDGKYSVRMAFPNQIITVLRDGFDPASEPFKAYVVSKRGVVITLSDPITNNPLIRTHVSKLSQKSLNAKSTRNKVKKLKADDPVEAEEIAAEATDATMIQAEVGASPVPHRSSFNEVTHTSKKLSKKGEPGVFEITLSDGNVFIVQKHSVEEGEWAGWAVLSKSQLGVSDTETTIDGVDYVWDSTWGLKRDAIDSVLRAANRLNIMAPSKEADKFRAAPTRRWVNEYGVSIEEFFFDQSIEKPESPSGIYYEVYLPSKSYQFEILERFYDPDPEIAKRQAFDKYQELSYYDNLGAHAWRASQQRQKVELGITPPPMRQGPSFKAEEYSPPEPGTEAWVDWASVQEIVLKLGWVPWARYEKGTDVRWNKNSSGQWDMRLLPGFKASPYTMEGGMYFSVPEGTPEPNWHDLITKGFTAPQYGLEGKKQKGKGATPEGIGRFVYWNPDHPALSSSFSKVSTAPFKSRGVRDERTGDPAVDEVAESNNTWDGFYDISNADGEAMTSLAFDTVYEDGYLPQQLVASKEEVGSTVEEVIITLQDAYGPGIFNVVTVVKSQTELPVGINQPPEGKRIRAVAFNNKVWIVADNISSERIVPVAMHEVGAHGIRAIIGDKAYMKLLSEISNLIKTDATMAQAFNAAKETLKARGMDKNSWVVLEETMAYYVEHNTPTKNTFWNVLLQYLLQGLHRLKLNFSSNYGGWQIMVLARSAMKSYTEISRGENGPAVNYMANILDMPLYMADSEWKYKSTLDDAMREGIDPDTPVDRIKEMIGKPEGLARIMKVKWGEKSIKEDEMLSFPAFMAGRRKTQEKARFTIEPGIDLERAFIDYFGYVERFEDAVAQLDGEITRKPSVVHRLYKTKVNQMRGVFRDEHELKFADFIKGKKITLGDFDAYVMAKHAPWRNKVIRGRKGTPSSGIWEFEHESRKEGEGRLSSEEILKELKGRLSAQQMKDLETAAQMVYNINEHRMFMLLEGGLVSQDLINKWMGRPFTTANGARQPANNDRKMFAATYVPLKGANINRVDEFFAGIFEEGRKVAGLEVKGLESRKIMGRTSPSESPFAHTMFEAERSIDRVEKNKVVVAFADMIFENQEMLKNHFTIVQDRDLYPKGRKRSAAKTDPDTGDLWLSDDDFGGLLPDALKNKEHVISFKRNGEQWHILVRDASIGRAFNRTRVKEMGRFLNVLAMANRYFAMIVTTLSPDFIMTNFSRDYQMALTSILHAAETRKGLSKDRAGALAKKITKSVPGAMRGMHKWHKHKQNDTYWSQRAQLFTEAGGRISFYGHKDAFHVEKDMQDYVDLATPLTKDVLFSKAGPRRLAKKTKKFLDKRAFGLFGLDFVSDVNTTVENTMRLATFSAMVDEFVSNGMTETEAIEQAADISVQLTVNFTMKGEWTPIFNSWWLFFNASTAGAAKLSTNFVRSKRLRKYAARAVYAQMAMSIASYFLAGEDDEGRNRYAQIPMTQRSRQMYVYVPWADEFAKIPLGYGTNMPFVLGDTIVAVGMGQINPWEGAVNLFKSMIESFSPLYPAKSDSMLTSLVKTASPTISDPLIDLVTNENWMGNPIYKVPYPGGATVPPAYRSWSSTTKSAKAISELINTATFGSKYEEGFISIEPTIIDYWTRFLTGGLGDFVKKSYSLGFDFVAKDKKMATDTITGEVSFNKIPIVRRFIHDEVLGKRWDTRDYFDKYTEEVLNARNFYKGIIYDFGVGSPEHKDFLKSEHMSIAKLDPLRKAVEGEITKLYKLRAKIRRSRLIKDDVKFEKTKQIELAIEKLKARFNGAFEKILDRGLRFGKAA